MMQEIVHSVLSRYVQLYLTPAWYSLPKEPRCAAPGVQSMLSPRYVLRDVGPLLHLSSPMFSHRRRRPLFQVGVATIQLKPFVAQ